jgi:hypothetical protein
LLYPKKVVLGTTNAYQILLMKQFVKPLDKNGQCFKY